MVELMVEWTNGLMYYGLNGNGLNGNGIIS